MDEKFKKAVEKVLALEGGYVNNPADTGGETKFGISKRSYPELDIKNLTREQAIEIYFRDFWSAGGFNARSYSDINDQAVADKLFDLAVNVGPKRAHELIQIAVRKTGGGFLDIDGMLGDLSFKAINDHPNPTLLLSQLRFEAIGYYLNRRKPEFLAGWIARALA